MNIKKLFKSKKGATEKTIKIMLWILFFIVLLAGVYFLIRNLINI